MYTYINTKIHADHKHHHSSPHRPVDYFRNFPVCCLLVVPLLVDLHSSLTSLLVDKAGRLRLFPGLSPRRLGLVVVWSPRRVPSRRMSTRRHALTPSVVWGGRARTHTYNTPVSYLQYFFYLVLYK